MHQLEKKELFNFNLAQIETNAKLQSVNFQTVHTQIIWSLTIVVESAKFVWDFIIQNLKLQKVEKKTLSLLHQASQKTFNCFELKDYF
jgi:lipid-A-disaccharide synthase-like uncharacterized protein